MDHPFTLCDVFATGPFSGNPLAVFQDGSDISDEAMYSLAREFGWSEITFVLPGTRPRVRIWTPWRGEIPFAGHPTVGTSVVIAATNGMSSGTLELELGVGRLFVEIQRAGPEGGRATMVQRSPKFGQEVQNHLDLARALGLASGDLFPGLLPQVVSTGLPHLLMPLQTLDALGRADPLPDLLPMVLAECGVHWVYLFTLETSSATARARLLSVGHEDPATGSAAGPLGAYLVRNGLVSPGSLTVEQGIEMGRPSLIEVEVQVEDDVISPIRVTGDVRIWGKGNVSLQ